MPKLLYSSASPYSAKVRMAAAYAGIAIEAVSVQTSERPAVLVSANPLGKIPTLVLDDGRSIFDSRAITQYLNRESKNALFPRNPDKRTEAEVLEALASEADPAGFALPADRFARATLRLTLRQQHRLAERFGSRIYAGLVARWRDAFDRASDTAAEDDNPGH